MVQCVEFDNGRVECYRDGFWDSDTGIIIKWVVLAVLFALFFAWFVGGYLHAKARLKKGLPLLAYHRFLVSYPERRRPRDHFTFYANPQPYYPPRPHQDPPPLYNSADAPPPQYYAPAHAATKADPDQHAAGAMEMPMYGAPAQGPQQSGVVGSGSGSGDVEQGQLPPRPPQQAKAAVRGMLDRFRR